MLDLQNLHNKNEITKMKPGKNSKHALIVSQSLANRPEEVAAWDSRFPVMKGFTFKTSEVFKSRLPLPSYASEPQEVSTQKLLKRPVMILRGAYVDRKFEFGTQVGICLIPHSRHSVPCLKDVTATYDL